MKHINEELQRRWKDRRLHSSGNWSGLIIKIALLVLVIWFLTGFRSGPGKYLRKFFLNNPTTEQAKELK